MAYKRKINNLGLQVCVTKIVAYIQESKTWRIYDHFLQYLIPPDCDDWGCIKFCLHYDGERWFSKCFIICQEVYTIGCHDHKCLVQQVYLSEG